MGTVEVKSFFLFFLSSLISVASRSVLYILPPSIGVQISLLYLSIISLIILWTVYHPAPRHEGRVPMDILRLYPCLFSFLFVFPFAVVPGHLDLVLLLFGVVLDMLPQAAGVSVSFLTSKHLTTVWLLQIFL